MAIFDSVFNKKSKDPLAEAEKAEAKSEKNVLTEEVGKMIGDTGELNNILVKNSINFVLETICYFIMVLAITAAILFYRIAPFDILMDMMSKSEVKNALGGKARIQDFSMTIRLLLIMLAIFSFVMARVIHSLRHSNNRSVRLLRGAQSLQKRISKM